MMDIAGLRTRIMIQKNTARKDRYGNHTPIWEDYFTCWAACTASGRSTEETQEAGNTQESDLLDITVRWCSETAAVNSVQYRILVEDRIYDITSIDDMGFKRGSRKFHTRLARR